MAMSAENEHHCDRLDLFKERQILLLQEEELKLFTVVLFGNSHSKKLSGIVGRIEAIYCGDMARTISA